MSKLESYIQGDIGTDIRRINRLLECGIFRSENFANVLLEAAFIDLLITIRDLMYKSEKYASRIAFDDDVNKTEEVNDVTDLIKYVRDAICHPESDKNYVQARKIKSTFNVVFGKGGLFKIGDFEQTSEYDDDICFFFGSQGIYLKRHIIRAFEEAKTNLLPLLRGK